MAFQPQSPILFDQVRKTPLFGAIFILKTIVLPRQARDKHRESTKNITCYIYIRPILFDQTIRANILFGISEEDANEAWVQQSLEASTLSLGEKTPALLVHFLMLKLIILPTQARDKHRKNSKKNKSGAGSSCRHGRPRVNTPREARAHSSRPERK